MSRRRAAPARVESLPDKHGRPLRAGDRVLIPYRDGHVRGRVHGFDPGGLVWVVFTPPGKREFRCTVRPDELELDMQAELDLGGVS